MKKKKNLHVKLSTPSSSITNLTVAPCNFDDACHLLKYLPELKSFHIQHNNYKYYDNEVESFEIEIDHHLKQLIIDNFEEYFYLCETNTPSPEFNDIFGR